MRLVCDRDDEYHKSRGSNETNINENVWQKTARSNILHLKTYTLFKHIPHLICVCMGFFVNEREQILFSNERDI